MASTVYMPVNPMSVNIAFPDDVARVAVGGAVEAVDQPRLAADLGVDHRFVFAMYGNGTASIRIQSIQRLRKSLPRHQRKAAPQRIRMKKVPVPP